MSVEAVIVVAVPVVLGVVLWAASALHRDDVDDEPSSPPGRRPRVDRGPDWHGRDPGRR